jgi:hypothetical protein
MEKLTYILFIILFSFILSLITMGLLFITHAKIMNVSLDTLKNMERIYPKIVGPTSWFIWLVILFFNR